MNVSASADAHHPAELQKTPDESAFPCANASPLGINYELLTRLLTSGSVKEACLALRRLTPFGGMLAALGDPFAAALCPLAVNDTPLIDSILRLLVKSYPDIAYMPQCDAFSEKNVLIIGSGPAGLQAAWTLRSLGHHVTVREAASEPGPTLLRHPVQESSSAPSAPSPAIPPEVVHRTIEMLKQSGIVFLCSSPVGQTELASLCKRYDSVLCACGKGAVLPANADGKVSEHLFAAGTCVKNQKTLGALQAMAFARKAAIAAHYAMTGCSAPVPNPSLPQVHANTDVISAACPHEENVVREVAVRCPACCEQRTKTPDTMA